MNFSVQTFKQNAEFENVLQAMEDPILQAITHYFKMDKIKKAALRAKVEPLATGIQSGKLKPKDLPEDLAERLGINPATQEVLLQAVNKFVGSLDLDKSKAKTADINRHQLEQTLTEAIEATDFGDKLAAKAVVQLTATGVVTDVDDSQEKECVKECLRIYLIEITLAFVIFAASLLVCAVITIFTFGLAAGPCIAIAATLLLAATAAGLAKYLDCLAKCKGLG